MGAPVEKKYNATIHLEFIAPIGQDHDIESLRQQIYQADATHPWVTYYTGGERAPSIRLMTSIKMREGEYIDRLYEVEINPPFLLTQAQTYAYERYGDQLAKTLAEIVPTTILRVDSRIRIEGVFHGGYRPGELQSTRQHL